MLRLSIKSLCTLPDALTIMRVCAQWANGAYHGAGVWSLPGGPSFRGGHAVGMRHGWGTAVDASGAVYEGQWVGGRRHGLGSQRSEDGSTYVGDFRCDRVVQLASKTLGSHPLMVTAPGAGRVLASITWWLLGVCNVTAMINTHATRCCLHLG